MNGARRIPKEFNNLFFDPLLPVPVNFSTEFNNYEISKCKTNDCILSPFSYLSYEY